MKAILAPILGFLCGFATLVGGAALGALVTDGYPAAADYAALSGEAPLTDTSGSTAQTSPGTDSNTAAFQAGTARHYLVSAAISGAGSDPGSTPVDVALNFESNFTLAVQSVDSWGMAMMQLNFDDVAMQGDFMGSPVSFSKSPQGVAYSMPGMTPSDASAPQIAFFDQPIRMRVAPDGQVLSVEGLQGFEQMGGLSSMTLPGLKDNTVNGETQWVSNFAIPIPGFPVTPSAQATNTIVGFPTIDGRQCAAVKQTLNSTLGGTPLSTASEFLGQFAGLTMPKFKIEGQNMLYYEVATSQLYQANLDFKLGLEIAPSMKKAVEGFTGLYKMLDEVEGNKTSSAASSNDASQSLNLGVAVKADVSLTSETTAADGTQQP